MPELSQDEKWKALMRGQVMSATVNKFTTIIRLLDQKAQVMIFLNSIIVPVCLNAMSRPELADAAIISIITAVLSILAAMICIYPKRRYRKSGDRELNLLHFNDIGHMDKEDYMDRFKFVLNSPERLAETVVHDLYDTSRFSILPKYTWLKLSYASFAFGNIIAIVVAFAGL
ncbi:MAG: Pycsar system effector family protein [Alphaproteobacteria bacterium]